MKKIIIGLVFVIAFVVALLAIIWSYKIRDNIELPFQNDPIVIGEWTTVDFIPNIEVFFPEKKYSRETNLYLKKLEFKENGDMGVPYLKWTKGFVTHQGDKTASAYLIQQIGNEQYMFFEWKSGDYVYLHKKPLYYVLKKTSN